MAMMTTPDGQPYYVPDGMFGPGAPSPVPGSSPISEAPPQLPFESQTGAAQGDGSTSLGSPAGNDPMMGWVTGPTGPAAAAITGNYGSAPGAVPTDVTPQTPQLVDPSTGLPMAPEPAPSRDYAAGTVDKSPKAGKPNVAAYAGVPESLQAARAVTNPQGPTGAPQQQPMSEMDSVLQREKQIAGVQGDIAAEKANQEFDVAKQAADAADVAQNKANYIAQETARETEAKRKDINVATQKWLDTKIDPARAWHNMGTGSKILAAISVALSGLGDALQRKSGPNAALAIITGAIDKDVAAQLRERDQAKTGIDARRTSLDDYERIAKSRIGAAQLETALGYEKARRQAALVAAGFAAPEAKLQAQALIAGLDEKIAGIHGSVASAAAAAAVKQQEIAIQRTHAQAAATSAYTGARAERLQENKEDWARNPNNPDYGIKVAELAQKLSPKPLSEPERKEISEKGIAGLEPVFDKNGKPVIDPATGVQKESINLLTRKDGSVWVPLGSPESAKLLRDQFAASDSVIRLADKIESLGPEWMSDTRNSDKLQILKQKWATMMVQAHELIIPGAITEQNMESVGAMFNNVHDPTQRKDFMAALRSAREEIKDIMATRLEKANYDKPYSPKNIYKAPAVDAELEALLNSKAGQSTTSNYGFTDLASEIGSGGGPGIQARKALESASAMPAANQTLDNYYRMASSNDPKVSTAGMNNLIAITKSSVATDYIRNAAQDMINKANAEQISRSSGQARDYNVK